MDAPAQERADTPWRDGVWWAFVAVALGIRLAILWGLEDPTQCTRDECIFRTSAEALLQGRPLPPTATNWLPAPGYPYLLALCEVAFGRLTAARELQIALTPLLLGFVWSLGLQAGDRRAARLATAAVALHPTLAFFTVTTWTESVYTLLLFATAWATLRARQGSVLRAPVAGALLGLTILTRGVATWMFPLFALALVQPDATDAHPPRRVVRRLLGWALGAALVVAPWSYSQSVRFGGLVISDATAGYVAWLGNDDFPPITYDYAIGPVDRDTYALRVGGRPPPCPRDEGPVAQDRCLLDLAVDHIVAEPGTFLKRVPVRLAQLFNPHTFLTRHLRWQYAPRLPWWSQEVLVVLTMLTSLVVTLGGGLAMWARARGPLALVTVGPVLYTIAVIAGLYGTSRFRLPLEALAIVWLAIALADPRATWDALRASRLRTLGAAVTLPVLAWASLSYAWTAWPGLLW